MALILAIASMAAAALAAAAFLRAARHECALRLFVLADCVGLLEDAALVADPAGFGVLKGRRDGFDVALRPLAEQLTFRRLPQLWLIATVRRPTGAEATIDILRRPTGGEYFSPGSNLPVGYAPPPDWPQDTSVRGSHGSAPLLQILRRPLAHPLAEDDLKEVTLTPRGARVVRRLRQGTRGAYLLFRDSRFDNPRAAPAEAEAAIALAIMVASLPNEGECRDATAHAA